MTKRRGLTLVEVLVVIAIVGLLSALLLPAVQAAREAARRSQCASNIRSLATGVLAYHQALSRFPPSGSRTVFAFDTGYQPSSWSWMARCLPFLEQQTLYDRLGVDSGGVIAGNELVKTLLPFGFCPSDTASSISPTTNCFNQEPSFLAMTPIAWTNYKGVMGSNWCWGDYPNNGTLTACGGSCCDVYFMLGRGKGDGILFRTDILYNTNAAQVRDGMSNTFLIGEDSPYSNPGSAWPYASHMVNTCAIPPNVNLNYRWGRWGDRPAPIAGSSEWAPLWQNTIAFHSRHPGGLQFANADSSVVFVSDAISLAVYRARSTKAGGEVVSADP
jgi:prepilin-type N-terminal cleavage/methylation domain-containing protein